MKSKKWAKLMEDEISQKTLEIMDNSVENMKKGKVSKPINLLNVSVKPLPLAGQQKH